MFSGTNHLELVWGHFCSINSGRVEPWKVNEKIGRKPQRSVGLLQSWMALDRIRRPEIYKEILFVMVFIARWN